MAREGHRRGFAGRLFERARAPLELEALLQPGGGRLLAVSLTYGLALSIVLWLVDAAAHALLLSGVGLIAAIVEPSSTDVWVRGLLAAMSLVFSVLYLRVRAAEQRSRVLAGAVEHAPDGIQIASLDGRVLYSNQAVETIFGIPRQRWRGRSVGDRNLDPDVARREILPALAARGEWQGELEVRRGDERPSPIWLTTAVIRDGRGRPLSLVGVMRDMTERRADEEALLRYARELEGANALKELFADIMRHDLLNPASTIRMSSEMLLARGLESHAQRLVRTIQHSAGRIIELCEAAASYAKLTSIEELDFLELDLGEVLREALGDFELAASDKEVVLSLDVPAPCAARASPIVREVFANLVSNAIKYSPRRSPVDVVVVDEVETWLVEVRDRGTGVRDDYKRRLFSRFERLDKGGVQGTGLGLAISKRVVDLHRGSIWVEDNAGGGAVFKVRLPKGLTSGGGRVAEDDAAARERPAG